MSRSYITFLLLAALWLGGVARPAWAGGEEDVRVVLATPGSLTVTATAGDLGARVYADGSPTAFLQLDRGTRIEVRERNGRVQLTAGGRGHSGALFMVHAPEGSPIRLGGQSYAGRLEFSVSPTSGRMQVINHVSLERYVAAVVGSEYGLDDVEGARAMAIVARTYALAMMEAGVQLLDDERSQVYRGEERLSPAVLDAARATEGQVLTYDGHLIEAVYSSSNGGFTASNASVWNTPELPYLTSRKDAFDAVSPHSEWTFDIDKGVLHASLSKQFGMRVRGIEVLETSRDGRVQRVKLKGSNPRTVTGTSFRAAVAAAHGASSARSSFFELKERGGSYRLEGHGFGHGVGLSQYGAHGRALAGQSHQEILAFYYPNARLESLSPTNRSNSSLDLPVLASVENRSEPPSSKISDGSATPKENNSTKSTPRRVLDAHAAWGRTPTRSDSDSQPSSTTPSATVRVGW